MKEWEVREAFHVVPHGYPHENSMTFSLVIYKDPLYIAKYLDLLDM